MPKRRDWATEREKTKGKKRTRICVMHELKFIITNTSKVSTIKHAMCEYWILWRPRFDPIRLLFFVLKHFFSLSVLLSLRQRFSDCMHVSIILLSVWKCSVNADNDSNGCVLLNWFWIAVSRLTGYCVAKEQVGGGRALSVWLRVRTLTILNRFDSVYSGVWTSIAHNNHINTCNTARICDGAANQNYTTNILQSIYQLHTCEPHSLWYNCKF